MLGLSLVVQTVKNPLAIQETWIVPLEEGMTTHSGILASRVPWTEELGRLQSTGLQGVRHDLVTKHSTPYPTQRVAYLGGLKSAPIISIKPCLQLTKPHQAYIQ